MTAFCSHHDKLHQLAGVSRPPIVPSLRRIYAKRLRALLRVAISRTSAAFISRDVRSLEPAMYGNWDSDNDAAKFPQRPLILSDKWDF
jgi:hypothetical protein